MRIVAIREDIKDLILDAAERLLSQYGYQKMTMDALAQEVGIGKGTLYLHYKSKEEIALSHIDRIIYRILVKLQIVVHREGMDAKEKLREMLLLRVLYRFDSVQHYTESLSGLLADIRPKLLARREIHFNMEAKVFTEVLEEGKRIGQFVFQDATITAQTLILMTNSLLPYGLPPHELGKRKDIEKKVSLIADLLLNGLLSKI
jgi:AcrR family transcriptional regulator